MTNLGDSGPAAEFLDAGAQVWVGQHVPAAIVHACRRMNIGRVGQYMQWP